MLIFCRQHGPLLGSREMRLLGSLAERGSITRAMVACYLQLDGEHMPARACGCHEVGAEHCPIDDHRIGARAAAVLADVNETPNLRPAAGSARANQRRQPAQRRSIRRESHKRRALARGGR